MTLMPYDRDSFIAGISVGRNMKSWPRLNGKKGAGNLFAFLIQITSEYHRAVIRIKTRDGITLDFGDGRIDEIHSGMSWWSIPIDYYDSEGYYICVITGDLRDFGIGMSGPSNRIIKRILTPFPASMSDIENLDYTFYRCFELESVPPNLLKHCRNITTANSTFSDCGKLTIPEGLFSGCSLVTSFIMTFGFVGEDIPAQSIPSDLFSGCTSAENFMRCFNYANIKTVPESLFDETPNANYFFSTFTATSPTIISTVPKLWDMFPNAYGETCFRGQTLINGYESIPSDWK